MVSPRVTRRMLELFGQRLPDDQGHASVHPSLQSLTPRELEVLTAIGAGLSNLEIAAKFFVSEATIKTHVGNVLAKTGSRDRVQAVVLAYTAGLVALRRFGGECGFRRGEWWVGVEVPEDQERPSFRIDSRGPRRVSRYGVR